MSLEIQFLTGTKMWRRYSNPSYCTESPTSIQIYTSDKNKIMQRFISTLKDHADVIET